VPFSLVALPDVTSPFCTALIFPFLLFLCALELLSLRSSYLDIRPSSYNGLLSFPPRFSNQFHLPYPLTMLKNMQLGITLFSNVPSVSPEVQFKEKS